MYVLTHSRLLNNLFIFLEIYLDYCIILWVVFDPTAMHTCLRHKPLSVTKNHEFDFLGFISYLALCAMQTIHIADYFDGNIITVSKSNSSILTGMNLILSNIS